MDVDENADMQGKKMSEMKLAFTSDGAIAQSGQHFIW
jgi:hypothetical protein